MEVQLLKQWIDVARWSPSGGNGQPWLVTILDSTPPKLKIEIDPNYAKSPSLMDIDGTASVLSIGAFVESLCQLAELGGFVAHVELHSTDYFSMQSHVQFSKKENFKAGNKKTEDLIQNIKSRHTNRNKFKTDKLPAQFLSWIDDEVKKENLFVRVFDKDRNVVISPLITLEHIRLLCPKLLNSLLEEILLAPDMVWTHFSRRLSV